LSLFELEMLLRARALRVRDLG